MNTEEIIEGYLGSTEVNSIYQGSELIWPKYNYKYMIGGDFKYTSPKKIIRLNNDGTKDNTWYNNSSYTSGGFYQLIYDNINKKIYAAGDPALDGGLVRFNMDGTKDDTFNVGTVFNDTIRSVIIYNSKIYAAGEFTSGSPRNRIYRLNYDGTDDIYFSGGDFDGFYGSSVYALNLDTNNQKIYVGGDFNEYKNGNQGKLVRLNMNGSLDTSFNIGTGFGDVGWVYALNLDTINQKLYVGGDFSIYNGIYRNNLVRLNLDGSLDTSFNIGSGFNGRVYALNLDTINQKLYVGGGFNKYKGNTQHKLIRLNMDGSKDTSFNIGDGFDSSIATTTVNAINIDTNNQKIYVGGSFSNPKYKFCRLNYDGSLDNTFNISLDDTVRTILKYKE